MYIKSIDIYDIAYHIVYKKKNSETINVIYIMRNISIFVRKKKSPNFSIYIYTHTSAGNKGNCIFEGSAIRQIVEHVRNAFVSNRSYRGI